MSAKKSTTKKSKQVSKLDHLNILIGLFFVLIFAVITSLSAYSTLAAKPPVALTTPNLSLTPSSRSVSSGSTLSVQIWADSGSEPVNAAQVNLFYPVDKLNFVNISTSNSSFGVEAQSSGGNGQVNIARGSTSPVTGKQLIATVNFTPLSTKGNATAAVNFTSGTTLLSSTTNQNILAATYSGSYKL
jgi:hypothetical protein